MEYEKCFKIIRQLEFDKEEIIYSEYNTKLSVVRPSKLSKRFKNYDLNKNFQIFLQEGDRKFKPNHLRVMIDLNLRVRTRPDLKNELALIFDNIFYQKEPDVEILKMKDEKFEHFLNSIDIIANLSQLFIIEQNYCYNGESNFDPPTLFYQGWVREFINSTKEIDNLCMSVCSRRPPSVKYTDEENKKHRNFSSQIKPLWYLK